MKKKYNDAELPIYEIVVDDTDQTGIRLISILDKVWGGWLQHQEYHFALLSQPRIYDAVDAICNESRLRFTKALLVVIKSFA